MTTLYPLEAELVVEPTVTATTVAWKLWWRLALGEGIHGTGPAGHAGLRFHDGGATIWTDYAEPSRLAQLDVPFGVVTGPGDDTRLLADGHIDDADAEVVDRLLGRAILERLVRAEQPFFTASVASLDSWAIAGRAALIETMLVERAQPVAGLWAIELEEVLYALAAGRSCERRRLELVQVGASAALLLPLSLQGAIERIPQLDDVLRTFATRNALEGPLVDALREQAAASAISEAERAIEAEAEVIAPSRVTRPIKVAGFRDQRSDVRIELPSFQGAASGPPEVLALRDYSVDGIVKTIDAHVDSDELELVIELLDPLIGVSQGLDVRVTGPDGFVAADLACERFDDDRLHSVVQLPTAMQAAELVVVVGRRLPFTSLDQDGFDERQAVGRTRQLVDALRAGQSSASLRERATDAWRHAGRPELGAVAAELETQEPFATERGADALRTKIAAALGEALGDSADTADVAAARDIVWSLGDVAGAAVIEGRRLSRPSAPPLPLEHHHALVLGLLASGDSSAARALDEQRPAPI